MLARYQVNEIYLSCAIGTDLLCHVRDKIQPYVAEFQALGVRVRTPLIEMLEIKEKAIRWDKGVKRDGKEMLPVIDGLMARQKRAIEVSDGLVAVLERPSMGAAMEIQYARGLGKPVALWGGCDEVYAHPWLMELVRGRGFDGKPVASMQEGDGRWVLDGRGAGEIARVSVRWMQSWLCGFGEGWEQWVAEAEEGAGCEAVGCEAVGCDE